MRSVAAIPATGLLVGCAVGLVFSGLPQSACLAILGGCAAVSVAWWLTEHDWPFILSVAAAFVAGGALLAADAWQRAWRPPLRMAFEQAAFRQRLEAASEGRRSPQDDEARVVASGVLRADAAPGATGVSLSIDLDEPAAGGVLVTVVGRLAAARLGEWRAGRRVTLPIELRRPSRYLDPGVPDFERALARRGTTLVGTVKSGALVEIVARGTWLAERVASARAFARRAIARAVGRWSPQSAAIVGAIVIGDRSGLYDDVQRQLQEAGTYHVIAISGGNIAVLAGLLVAAFRLGGVLGRGAMLATIALLVAYAHFVGGGASVERATLMAVVYFAGRAIDQRSPPLNTLAVVIALLVAADPLTIADPAFILTSGATLAILLVMPIVRQQSPRRALRPIVTLFAASVATETMLLPVGALAFSRVTFAGLALNFVAIPLMAVAQIAGMAVVPTAVLSPRAAALIGYAAHLGAAGLVTSAGWVEFVPMLAFRVAAPALAVVAIYYGALAFAWAGIRRPMAGTIAALAAIWIVAEPWTLVTAGGDGRLHVTFVDVGQGDSALVRFPGGSTLLIDAGGLSPGSAFDIGDRVVAPVMRAAGIRRLDKMALTHGDSDHIGGAEAIIREFRPIEVWEGIPVPRFEPMTALRLQAQAAGGRWANVYAGNRIVIDGVDVSARHPATADWERQRVRNDDSIVVELGWRDVSIVLTGDIGEAVERPIGPTVSRAPLRVLKVPHHGSLTSSSVEFLRALHPQVAVVSAGRSNHFGHPTPEVLQRYRDIGAEVFRTDQDGAVTVDTDGWSIDVQTFTGRKLELKTPTPHHEDTKTTKAPRP